MGRFAIAYCIISFENGYQRFHILYLLSFYIKVSFKISKLGIYIQIRENFLDAL